MGNTLARGLKERESECGKRQSGSRKTADWRKCDSGCPVMTPLQNTTDMTHAEWMRPCRRQGQGDGERGKRQAAEGRGCDVTGLQRQRLLQKGQRQRRGAVSYEEKQQGGHVHSKPVLPEKEISILKMSKTQVNAFLTPGFH